MQQLVAKHEHRPLLDIALRVYRRDRESAGTVVGSAVAFRLFLFFVPFVLFIVGLLGFLRTWSTTEGMAEQAGVTGQLAIQIDAALSQPNSSRWIATLLGLVGMVWAGRSLSRVMVSASCLAWRLPVLAKASMRVVGGVVGVFAGIGLIVTIMNRVRAELGLAAAGLSFLAVVVVYGVAWGVVSLMLPRATTDPAAVLPGAALVALAISGLQAVSQFYLSDQITRASALYGTIGVSLVILGWFFILGRTIVIAMVLNAVIHQRFGTISQTVFSLPLLRALPRKSPWLRRFFDLDIDGGPTRPIGQSPTGDGEPQWHRRPGHQTRPEDRITDDDAPSPRP